MSPNETVEEELQQTVTDVLEIREGVAALKQEENIFKRNIQRTRGRSLEN